VLSRIVIVSTVDQYPRGKANEILQHDSIDIEKTGVKGDVNLGPDPNVAADDAEVVDSYVAANQYFLWCLDACHAAELDVLSYLLEAYIKKSIFREV